MTGTWHMKKQTPYHAYLLRCWRESDASSDSPTWRFSLEGVQDSQRHGFADLPTLLAFLQQITQPERKSKESNVPS